MAGHIMHAHGQPSLKAAPYCAAVAVGSRGGWLPFCTRVHSTVDWRGEPMLTVVSWCWPKRGGCAAKQHSVCGSCHAAALHAGAATCQHMEYSSRDTGICIAESARDKGDRQCASSASQLMQLRGDFRTPSVHIHHPCPFKSVAQHAVLAAACRGVHLCKDVCCQVESCHGTPGDFHTPGSES